MQMGWVDRHNRFRQDILGLYRVWKTKSWQQRFLTEFFGIALVDAFLLARKFIPRWMNAPDTESVFWQFTNRLLPQMAQFSDPPSYIDVPGVSDCEIRLQGKYTVEKGAHAGERRTKQQRCTYCKRAKRTKKDGRATRTCYTCVSHPKIFMCKKSCWEEHLADQEFEPDSDAEDSDGGASSARTSVRTPDESVARFPRPSVARTQPLPRMPIAEGNEESSSSSDDDTSNVMGALVAANLKRRTPAQRNLTQAERKAATEKAIRDAAAFASSHTIVGTQSPARRTSARTSARNSPSARTSERLRTSASLK